MSRNISMKGMHTPPNYFKNEGQALKNIAAQNTLKLWSIRIVAAASIIGIGLFAYHHWSDRYETVSYANYIVEESNWDLYADDLIEETYIDLLVHEDRKNEIESYIVESYDLDELMDY